MASSSGKTTITATISGCEEDLQTLMDERKRKRMISNRESARRSRMRKQKHLDDLMAELAQLRKENQQIIAIINETTQHFLNIDADNSILRAQVGELSQRLESLNEIIEFLSGNNNGFIDDSSNNFNEPAADSFLNPLNLGYLNQPIMASPADIFQY